MTSAAQRAELQSQIWKIANDVRGAVDGWDFKQYVLGALFYRFISENFSTLVTQVIINQPDLQADVAQQPRQFSSDQTIKEELIAFRDTVIAKQFKIDARCLLSPLMIDLFIKHKPLDMDEFRSEIPLKIRQNLDVEQLSFISNIFEILEKADE